MTIATETLEITHAENGATRDRLAALERITREARRAADALDDRAGRGMTAQERFTVVEAIWRELLSEIYAMDSGR